MYSLFPKKVWQAYATPIRGTQQPTGLTILQSALIGIERLAVVYLRTKSTCLTRSPPNAAPVNRPALLRTNFTSAIKSRSVVNSVVNRSFIKGFSSNSPWWAWIPSNLPFRIEKVYWVSSSSLQ